MPHHHTRLLTPAPPQGLYTGCLYFFLPCPHPSYQNSAPPSSLAAKATLLCQAFPYSPKWHQLFPTLLYGPPSASCIPWGQPLHLAPYTQIHTALSLIWHVSGLQLKRKRQEVCERKWAFTPRGAEGSMKEHRWSEVTGPRTGGSASPASWASIFHHGITCYLNPPFLSPSFSSSFLPSFLFSLPPFLKRGAVILLPRRWKLILRIWPKKISYYNGVWLSKAQLCPKKSY